MHCFWELRTERDLAEDFALHAVPDACVNLLLNQHDTRIAGVWRGDPDATVDHSGHWSSSSTPSPGGSMVYFSCDDCAVEPARVVPAGGSVVRPKFPIGDHGFVPIITDTEGNMIGRHSTTAQRGRADCAESRPMDGSR